MNWDNLCDTCLNEFATCIPGEIVFGIDIDPALAFHKDSDKVLECKAYMNTLPDTGGVKR